MAKFALMNEAIILRKSGYSYSEIKDKIKIGKGTLSFWLKNYPLTTEQLERIRNKKHIQIENYRNTMRQKKELRFRKVYDSVKSEFSSFSLKETYFAGLFLYWGEGSKTRESMISITNSDPTLLLFFIHWCTFY